MRTIVIAGGGGRHGGDIGRGRLSGQGGRQLPCRQK